MQLIAFTSFKGGCGKTTTTVNLAASLAADGASVLAVDLDPQAHTTLALGTDPDAVAENIYDVLVDPDGAAKMGRILVEVSEGLDLAPAGIVLSALEQKLSGREVDSPTQRLSAALAGLSKPYDFVLIDCPPNVGLLTFNALRAAREVVIPLETSFFAIDGVQRLFETIELLSERLDHKLSVRVLPTLYDGRTRYARETLGEIRELFKDQCFDSVIRLNVKLREAAQRGQPICAFAPRANGAIDYAALALEVAASSPRPDKSEDEDAHTTESGALREVVIHFQDAEAGDVRIAGDFNGWMPDKGVRSVIESSGPARVWTKILQLPPGTYQYRYVVDGEWRCDPSNPNSVPNPSGRENSVLVIT